MGESQVYTCIWRVLTTYQGNSELWRDRNPRPEPINQLNRTIMNYELFSRYYTHTVKLKKKGAGKGYKKTVSVQFRPDRSRREFLNDYARTDLRGCGLFLCKVEHNEAVQDRYWDCPGYRDEFKREYRAKIKAIRAKYGLSQSEVKPFMAI